MARPLRSASIAAAGPTGSTDTSPGSASASLRAFSSRTRRAQTHDPDEVFALTKQCLNPADPVEAIYFQGAVLDPIKVLEKMKQSLG